MVYLKNNNIYYLDICALDISKITHIIKMKSLITKDKSITLTIFVLLLKVTLMH